jgi:zinc transporter, ZIP family
MTAFLWGVLASSSLVIGGVIILLRPLSQRTVALIMAFGAGTLISALAYDLVEDAFERGDGRTLFTWLAIGALTFYVGDYFIDKWGGEHRKRSTGAQASGAGAAIAFGTVLDGVPESVVLGTSLLTGGAISMTFLIAVFVSNLPEAMAATAGLSKSGAKPVPILALWASVTLVAGIAAAAGFAVLDGSSGTAIAAVQAFAAGALITMLADTMIPEAYEFGGRATGLLTALGFSVAFGLQSIGA